MEATIFFKTVNGSYYLYDMKQSILLNSHPILEEIHNHKDDPSSNDIKKCCKMNIFIVQQSIY